MCAAFLHVIIAALQSSLLPLLMMASDLFLVNDTVTLPPIFLLPSLDVRDGVNSIKRLCNFLLLRGMVSIPCNTNERLGAPFHQQRLWFQKNCSGLLSSLLTVPPVLLHCIVIVVVEVEQDMVEIGEKTKVIMKKVYVFSSILRSALRVLPLSLLGGAHP